MSKRVTVMVMQQVDGDEVIVFGCEGGQWDRRQAAVFERIKDLFADQGFDFYWTRAQLDGPQNVMLV